MKDMIQLEKLKNFVFWDYERANKIIDNLKDKRMGKKPRHDIRIKKTDKNSVIADDSLVPLSYSAIANPQ